MRIAGIVASELETRAVPRKDGSTGHVNTIKVLDDSTGDVVEVTTWSPDPRLTNAQKGEEIEFDAKAWNAYNGRLRIEAKPENGT